MFRIGQFSKLAHISVRMLRFYDDNDLLKPRYIDPKTKYRYYEADQLPVAGKINSLKMLGFGTKEIKEVLDSEDEEIYYKILEMKKDELENTLETVNNQIFLVDRSLKKLKEETMKYNINLKEIPKKRIAYIRGIIPSYSDEGILFGKLMQESFKNGLSFVQPIYSGSLYYDEEFKEDNIDLEVFVEVDNEPESSVLKYRDMPEQTVVSCVVKGSYDQFSDVNKEIATWIEENNYEFSGPMFNIYYVSPGQTNNPEEYITEVCYPVVKSK